MKHLVLLLTSFLLLGAMSSCTNDPVTPLASTNQVTITGPTQGIEDYPYDFTAKTNFTTTSGVKYQWLIGDSSVSLTTEPRTKLTFHGIGEHPFRVKVLDASSNVMICQAIDTFTVDTEHAIVTVDTSTVLISKPVTLHVTLVPIPLPARYQVIWTLDTATRIVQNINSLTWSFATVGLHRVTATCLDTAGHPLGVGIISITAYTPPPSDSTPDFTWTEYHLPNTDVTEDNCTGVWVFNAHDILACNYYLYRFDGSSWKRETLNGTAPYALSGASIFGFNDNDFWIVDGSIMYHWNGTAVEETRLEKTGIWNYPHDGSIHGAWGTSSNDMFFVGDSGVILHYDGLQWMKFPKVTTENLQSVWGTNDANIWVAGYDEYSQTSVLLHFDGSEWTVDPLSNIPVSQSGAFLSVWACDSAGHAITAASGSYVYRKTDNGSWRCDSANTPGRLPDGSYDGMLLAGASANDLFAVGSFGLVAHWNGKSWHRYDQFLASSDPAYFPRQVSMHGGTVCIAGYRDGSSWILVGNRQ